MYPKFFWEVVPDLKDVFPLSIFKFFLNSLKDIDYVFMFWWKCSQLALGKSYSSIYSESWKFGSVASLLNLNYVLLILLNYINFSNITLMMGLFTILYISVVLFSPLVNFFVKAFLKDR